MQLAHGRVSRYQILGVQTPNPGDCSNPGSLKRVFTSNDTPSPPFTLRSIQPQCFKANSASGILPTAIGRAAGGRRIQPATTANQISHLPRPNLDKSLSLIVCMLFWSCKQGFILQPCKRAGEPEDATPQCTKNGTHPQPPPLFSHRHLPTSTPTGYSFPFKWYVHRHFLKQGLKYLAGKL